MNAAMVHRADDEGCLVDSTGMALGARRLSIIDVEGGHQPVTNEEGTIWAVDPDRLIDKLEQEAGKSDGFSNPQISVGGKIAPALVALEKRLEAQ